MEQSIKRLRRIMRGMKNRCGNPNDPNYKNYGGRGIRICDGWLHSTDAFIVWALSNGRIPRIPQLSRESRRQEA